MASHLRQIGIRHNRTIIDYRQKLKKNGVDQHIFLHLKLKSLVDQADERSCKLMSLVFHFTQNNQVTQQWR